VLAVWTVVMMWGAIGQEATGHTHHQMVN